MNVYILVVFAVVTALSVSQKYKVIDIRSTGYTHLDNYGISPTDNQLIFELRGCSGGSINFLDEKEDKVYNVHFVNKPGSGVLKTQLFARGKRVFIAILNHSDDCDMLFKLKLTWKNGNFALWNYHTSGWRMVGDDSSSLEMDAIKYVRIHMGGSATLQWKVYAIEHTTIPYRVNCMNF